VGIKAAEFLLYLQKGPGVLDGGVDLLPVADDARILQQFLDLGCIVLGDFCRIKVVEGFPISFSLFEDGAPTQPGLSAVEDEIFK